MTLLSSLYDKAEIGFQCFADFTERVYGQMPARAFRCRVMRSCEPVYHLFVSIVSLHQEPYYAVTLINRVNWIFLACVGVFNVKLDTE